ncbi:DUF6257 family protein [Streptomyces sp. NPDC059080]|uniref:DUF6257 family protein n=1 Tax=Streptomyces sp. NPDC059080 TaxID=3346718 RepID=UPI0036C6E3A8
MAKHDDPKLTASEKAKVTVLVARMCKRSVAGEDVDRSDLERRVDQILDGAREREERTAQK